MRNSFSLKLRSPTVTLMGRKMRTASDDDDDLDVIAAVKGNIKGGVSSFDLLDEVNGINGQVSDQQIDDVSVIFAGKKKSSKENKKGDGSLFAVLRFEALVEGDGTRMTRTIIYFPLFF